MHIYGVVFIYCQLFYWMSADCKLCTSSKALELGVCLFKSLVIMISFATCQQNKLKYD